jgi:hypothetical protein
MARKSIISIKILTEVSLQLSLLPEDMGKIDMKLVAREIARESNIIFYSINIYYSMP